MSDEESKWDMTPSPTPSRSLAFSSPAENRAFPNVYVEPEPGLTPKFSRISGGLSTKIGPNTSVDVGTERIPTDRGTTYGATVGLRTKF